MLLLNTTLNSSITNNITTNWSPCELLWGLMTVFPPAKTNMAERPLNTLLKQWTKSEQDDKTTKQKTMGPVGSKALQDPPAAVTQVTTDALQWAEPSVWAAFVHTDKRTWMPGTENNRSFVSALSKAGVSIFQMCRQHWWTRVSFRKCACVTAVSVGLHSKNVNQCCCLTCADRDLLYS